MLFSKLYAALGSLGGHGAGIALLHDTEFREHNVDVEAGICLGQAMPVQYPLRCYQLPSITVASIVHHGPFNRIAGAYGPLLRWIELNGYQTSTPTREIFLHVSTPVNRDDESNVTEIQVPVVKGEAPSSITDARY